MAADAGDVSVLALLDLSSAFDTVDHTILLIRLRSSHHIGGVLVDWFESYLRERYKSVIYSGLLSPPVLHEHGVLQCSVLGPLLFVMYTAEIPHLVSDHGLLCVCYADDTQFYFHIKQDKIPVAKVMLEECIQQKCIHYMVVK